MPVLTDLTNELETYLDTYVTCEFVEVDIPGNTLNVNEEVKFQLAVRNTGPLNLTDLEIRLVGRNGTLVKSNGAIDDLGPEAVQPMRDGVRAHNGNDPERTPILTFKAPPGTKGAGTDLVEVFIDTFDANLDHLLLVHGPRASTTPRGLYESRVRNA